MIGRASFVVVITVILVFAVLRDPPQPSFLFSSQNIWAEVVEMFFLNVEEGRSSGESGSYGGVCGDGVVVEMSWLALWWGWRGC